MSLKVNQTSIGIGITLNVGGRTTSGELASKKSYFVGIAQGMASAGGSDEIKAGFQQLFKRLNESPEASDEATSEENQLPRFIHLKNAKILNNAIAIPINSSV